MAVGTRGANIDNVLIGPGEVYTVNTKTHPGSRVWVGRHAIKVSGRSVDYSPKSRHEAQRAERLLTAVVGLCIQASPTSSGLSHSGCAEALRGGDR